MMPIMPVGVGLTPITTGSATSGALAGASASQPAVGAGSMFNNFGDLLGQALNAVNSTQAQADSAATQLVTGQSTDVHTAMIDMEQAKVTFDLAVQVRNKGLDAYNQLMQTQV